METSELAGLWDAAYARRGAAGVSWYQAVPAVSLELVAALAVPPTAAVVDVGGGASALARELAARGYADVSVVDLSGAALAAARRDAGDAPIAWIEADVLAWRPERRFDLWHDRAVFHFLVEPDDRARYRATLEAAVAAHGAVVIGTFAADGPPHCSGLPVARYAPDELAAELGPAFAPLASRREEHATPGGAVQPFTWLVARRRG